MRLGLTYDDCLLVPKRSAINSRKEVNTATNLTPTIPLAIPIVSANMDTVTESEMAISMATLGGIGIIHRFLPIEDQVKEVIRVKRYEHYVIEDPITISPNSSLAEAKQIIKEYKVTSLLVIEKNRKLTGIITMRDMMFENNLSKKVTTIMTTRQKLVTAKHGISLKKAKTILHKYKIEKLPLVDEKGCLAGLITARDILRMINHPQATKDNKGRLMVGAAIGVREKALDRAAKLINAGCDVLVLDVAYGYADHTLNMLHQIRKTFPSIPIIAGNIATSEAANDLIKAGAQAIKVGIGPGSMCTTRIIAAAGVPQLTAVLDCSKVARQLKIPVIADGGVRFPGDMAKAIAAGASTVMVGGLFAGTSQSPGTTVMRNGRKYKISRGMASVGANVYRNNDQEWENYVAEGVEAFVAYRGDVNEIVHQLVGGLRSGMSYVGAKTIAEFWRRAEFIQVTQNGLKESLPHDVELL